MRYRKFAAFANLDREANERYAARLAALTKAGRYETRITSGSGLARYVRREGVAALASQKALNFKEMRHERQQVAYSYVRTVRTDD